ncbi:hypothetical protein CH330_09265, partial [candidate division WOR-3 bacterium JGI_Cruoil_03_51_56]
KACGLKMEVVTDDLVTAGEEAWEEGQYHSYNEIVAILRNLAATYPSICVLDSFGTTYEGAGLSVSKSATIRRLMKMNPNCSGLVFIIPGNGPQPKCRVTSPIL